MMISNVNRKKNYHQVEFIIAYSFIRRFIDAKWCDNPRIIYFFNIKK